MLVKGKLLFAKLFVSGWSFATANKEIDQDVDDFKPHTKRPNLTKRMKVFSEWMPGRVLSS